MTDQEAAEGPQERPGGGSAAPRPPGAGNGAQAGADSLGWTDKHAEEGQ